MNTPNDETVTRGATNPADLARRTGPGRVTSINREKIKVEDAARDAALHRAASEGNVPDEQLLEAKRQGDA